MSGHVKAFIAILVLGAVAILGYRYALPQLQDSWQRQTSDAAATRGKLVVGMDSWVGYFPLCSPEMAKRMRAEGYALRCDDDKADYATRFKRLADGELDLAVATVDTYLLNGAKLDYPAAIVAVLDESKGGDAIVARVADIPNLEALKRKLAARIAYTPNSPSEHLLKSVGTHFDLPQLQQRRGAWRVEADGSSDALKKLLAGQAEVAVLWEPDVSKALANPALVKLIGTEDTDKLIVDILLASRRLVQEQPQVLENLLRQYFETLRHYDQTPDQRLEHVAAFTGLSGAQADAVTRGVRWATLNDNGALWFGVTPSGLPGETGLIGAIEATLGVLQAAGDFERNPLPDQDPYRITNRQFVSNLYLTQGGAAAVVGGARTFTALDEAGWAKLREVGTLRIEPVGFARASATLDDDGRQTLDRVARKLGSYPNYRVVIKGHTGLGGDAAANLELSKQRAQAVAEHLMSSSGQDAHRLRALGYGSSQPLPRLADESDRAYGYRLPRVEITLLTEAY